MNGKNQLTHFAVITLLALGLFLSLNGANAQVDLPLSPTPDSQCASMQPPPPLAPAQEKNVRAAAQQTLDKYNVRWATSATLTIVSVWGKDNWAVAECVPTLQRGSIVGTEGVMMLLRNINGVWQTALPGDSNYSLWLEQIPPQYLSPTVKGQMQQLNLVAPELIDPSVGIYRLPYLNGATVRVTQDSDQHGGAVDFWSANGSVVAAMDGWVEGFYDDHSECCCNSACGACNNWIRLRHANGEYTDYHHIARNSVQVSVGQWVPAGTVIATQSDVGWSCGVGRSETGCGSFNQDNPNYNCAVHLHFAVIAGGTARKPRFCDGSGGWFYPAGGNDYTARSCPNPCCCSSMAVSGLSETPSFTNAGIGFLLLPTPAVVEAPATTMPAVRPVPTRSPETASPVSAAESTQGLSVELQHTPPASANYRIPRSVFGTGGGLRTSTHFVMQGTSGQTTGVDWRQSTDYVLRSGYWTWEFAAHHTIYLPIVLRHS